MDSSEAWTPTRNSARPSSIGRTLLIAEIGINHNGSAEAMLELVDAAASAGCWAVKFQYRNPTRAYAGNRRELGDEIVGKAIDDAFLPASVLAHAAEAAHDLGLNVGISFFTAEDVPDVLDSWNEWDFFKVPSAELLNSGLVDALLATDRPLFLSTGAHTEAQVTHAFGRLSPNANWIPMHCVSNYPTQVRNASLGQITHLQQRWDRLIGYSSHDDMWEMCVGAAVLGAQYIERHITLDKEARGLDHSTSSTPTEIRRLQSILQDLGVGLQGDGPRQPNQGELINLQNLGRSYYFTKGVEPGEQVSREALTYASPRAALDFDAESAIGMTAVKVCTPGAPFDQSAVVKRTTINQSVVDFCDEHRVGIPIRPHDQEDLLESVPVATVEYHLSFGDLDNEQFVAAPSCVRHASVHLPDYSSPYTLLDPFSDDADLRSRSLALLKEAQEVAMRLQDQLGVNVPLIGSFSTLPQGPDRYIPLLQELIGTVRSGEVDLLPQWLPPFAWYFGGSIPIRVMTDPQELEPLDRSGVRICLDTAHFAMSCHYFEYAVSPAMAAAIPLAGHIHLGEAAGFDSEGLSLGSGPVGSPDSLGRILSAPTNKVIEVWQGHLMNGAGFRAELDNLYELCREA